MFEVGNLTGSVSSARQLLQNGPRKLLGKSWEIGGAHMTYDMQHTSTQRVPL